MSGHLLIYTVVDSYSAWCGPCKAIVSSFKRLKNELGDDLLVFATVSIEHVFFIFHSEYAVMEI